MNDTEPARRSGPPIDLVALVAGLVCAVLWAAFTFADLDSFHEISRVVWPTVLVGVGIGLLAGSRR